MAILDVLNRPVFDSRYKLPTHVLQVVIVVVAIGFSVPRLFMKNIPRTRSSTIALGMGAKSLILLAYMILTEHVARFRRWHSYKANVIISCLEILFWSGVAGLVFQANMKSCVGISCTLSWVVFGLAVVMIFTEQYSTAISIREFREYRKIRDGKPSSGTIPTRHHRRHHTDEEEMMEQYPSQPKQTYAQTERQHAEHGHSQNDRQTSERFQQGQQRSQYPPQHDSRGQDQFVQHNGLPRHVQK